MLRLRLAKEIIEKSAGFCDIKRAEAVLPAPSPALTSPTCKEVEMAAESHTMPLTAARLREVMHYDPDTGVFTWLVTRGAARVGAKAGAINNRIHGAPRRRIGLFGRNYEASHLAWLYMTGSLPTKFIDHRNGDSLDDRWTNLREATPAQNQANKRISRNNSIGLKGVSRRNRRYRASIRAHGRQHHLGYFDSPKEAHAAYCAAALEYFGEFGRAE